MRLPHATATRLPRLLAGLLRIGRGSRGRVRGVGRRRGFSARGALGCLADLSDRRRGCSGRCILGGSRVLGPGILGARWRRGGGGRGRCRDLRLGSWALVGQSSAPRWRRRGSRQRGLRQRRSRRRGPGRALSPARRQRPRALRGSMPRFHEDGVIQHRRRPPPCPGGAAAARRRSPPNEARCPEASASARWKQP